MIPLVGGEHPGPQTAVSWWTLPVSPEGLGTQRWPRPGLGSFLQTLIPFLFLCMEPVGIPRAWITVKSSLGRGTVKKDFSVSYEGVTVPFNNPQT